MDHPKLVIYDVFDAISTDSLGCDSGQAVINHKTLEST